MYIFYDIESATQEAEKYYFDNYGYLYGVYFKEAKDCNEFTFYSNSGKTKEHFICQIKH